MDNPRHMCFFNQESTVLYVYFKSQCKSPLTDQMPCLRFLHKWGTKQHEQCVYKCVDKLLFLETLCSLETPMAFSASEI